MNEKKILIVIPDWGLAWNIYCIEYAISLRELGVSVSILDLSHLNVAFAKRRWLKLILRVVEKNRLSTIKRSLFKAYSIVNLKSNFRISKNKLESVNVNEEFFRLAMASKYSHYTGKRETFLADIDPALVQFERVIFKKVLVILDRLLGEDIFDEVITVNGRFIVDGAVVLTCKSLDIPIRLLEAANSVPGKYEVFNISPHHNRTDYELKMAAWESAPKGREEVAQSVLHERFLGTDKDGSPFRHNFKDGYFPDPNGKLIASFFPNSDREFALFPEFLSEESFEGTQERAFLIFSKIAAELGYLVVVRAHPVNKGLSPTLQAVHARVEDEKWSKLAKMAGAEFISSESTISSYSLIEQSAVCVTYVSTIGIETFLRNKPTLLLGNSTYSSMLSNLCAFNEDMIRHKLQNLDRLQGSVTDLYPWGYWVLNGGKALTKFTFASDDLLYFSGKQVNERRKLLNLLSRMTH